MDFFYKFGPSARSAYKDTLIDDYEVKLNLRIAKMTYEDIDAIFEQAGLDFSTDVSHQVALISAGTRRDQVVVAIPTRYLYELLIKRFSGVRQQAAARLYEVFMRNPYTKSAAGYMLDGEYHRVLCKGGQWQISPMKSSNKAGRKFTHWTFQGEEPDTSVTPLYLRLGFEGQIISFSTSKLSDDAMYSFLPPSEETLDSFIYEATSKTATIFQATVAKLRSVKEGGIEWLQGLGVERFRYIAVTAPRLTFKFFIPKSMAGRSGSRYS